MHFISNESRLEALEISVFKHFGEVEIDESDGTERVTEMFEVGAIGRDEITLVHLFNDEIFRPVHVPQDIKLCLRRRDIFLMTLAKHDGVWRTEFMMGPYESQTWEETVPL